VDGCAKCAGYVGNHPIWYAEQNDLGSHRLVQAVAFWDADLEPGGPGGMDDRTADPAVADHGDPAKLGRGAGRRPRVSVPF
jgi:hypothetical protein